MRTPRFGVMAGWGLFGSAVWIWAGCTALAGDTAVSTFDTDLDRNPFSPMPADATPSAMRPAFSSSRSDRFMPTARLLSLEDRSGGVLSAPSQHPSISIPALCAASSERN